MNKIRDNLSASIGNVGQIKNVELVGVFYFMPEIQKLPCSV